MNGLIPLLSAIVLHGASPAATGDGAPQARLPGALPGDPPAAARRVSPGAARTLRLAQSMSGCNPRVRLCERGDEAAADDGADAPDARERRSWLRGTLACNPRLRICDEG